MKATAVFALGVGVILAVFRWLFDLEAIMMVPIAAGVGFIWAAVVDRKP